MNLALCNTYNCFLQLAFQILKLSNILGSFSPDLIDKIIFFNISHCCLHYFLIAIHHEPERIFVIFFPGKVNLVSYLNLSLPSLDWAGSYCELLMG